MQKTNEHRDVTKSKSCQIGSLGLGYVWLMLQSFYAIFISATKYFARRSTYMNSFSINGMASINSFFLY